MKSNILICGDVCIDHSIYTRCERISLEAPVPILDYERENRILGMAANTAMGIANAGIPSVLSCKVLYNDSNISKEYNFLKNECIKNKIDFYPLYMEDFPPLNYEKKINILPIKQRIISCGQHICRIDFEDKTFPSKEIENKWYNQILNIIGQNDIKIVLFCDYAKGGISDNLIQKISDYCYSLGIITVLDPKKPLFYELKNITIIKPNKKELLSTNLTAEACSRLLKDTYLINTLGNEGMKIYKNGLKIMELPTFAHPSEVIDVNSCGDAITAMIGIGLYNGLSINQTIVASNKAAHFCIQQQGTYALNRKEIDECLEYAKLYEY